MSLLSGTGTKAEAIWNWKRVEIYSEYAPPPPPLHKGVREWTTNHVSSKLQRSTPRMRSSHITTAEVTNLVTVDYVFLRSFDKHVRDLENERGKTWQTACFALGGHQAFQFIETEPIWRLKILIREMQNRGELKLPKTFHFEKKKQKSWDLWRRTLFEWYAKHSNGQVTGRNANQK